MRFDAVGIFPLCGTVDERKAVIVEVCSEGDVLWALYLLYEEKYMLY